MKKINLSGKCILLSVIGVMALNSLNKTLYKRNKELEQTKEKRYYQLFDNWMNLLERGKNLSDYFLKNGFSKIAIYGYGNIGKHIISQLTGTEINVEYVVDRRAGLKIEGIERYTLRDDLPEIDAMIITPIMEHQSIETEMQSKVSGKILSIEDIIYELL